ncbi:DNA-formamidopyrimidine glycosylase family protein [Cellulomonas fimi]|uniref:DNA-(apurinic or apyrimidinic site) lyase n=1 Tax=Cellulomonas fimi TaxID=1708 RepID=A0A7Y0LUY3_CELFI|nr:DNA-formamidopyrimidine glycosylase family protein [Cellulomonas fimi]NMR18638.1 Fpg/Nei family DNA glycosylase [Cellulomonas fimi]
MPEGHTVHRIALQFRADFVGHRIAASSPQGRFAAGAALLDGSTMVESRAIGKQLFLGFDDDRWLRVHLGLYGAWDFRGRISPVHPESPVLGSMGAPRAARAVRMGEGELPLRDGDDVAAPEFPPPPIGQVRVRLLTEESLADLRGPTACEVLQPDEVAVAMARLGPDPMVDPGPEAEAVFVERLTSRATPVGQLLMDQAVVSGIGNVYRAEILFRARLDPHTRGRTVPAEVARGLWRDWTELLADGVRRGVMMTRDGLDDDAHALALADQTARHWVYKRAGLPCYVCGTPIQVETMAGRNLYWCPTCQD